MSRLEEAAPILRRMAYSAKLSADEVYRAMSIINEHDEIATPDRSDGFYFLALTFGLMSKGPSDEELLGIVQHIDQNSVHLTTAVSPDQLIDISGTGGDSVKTFNVGTTASFIIAAAGRYVAKQATRGYTGFTGSADIYQTMGLDPFRVGQDDVVQCLERVGITAFYTPAMSPGFKNRIDFLSKLLKVGLTYPTPWHLVSWVYSPFKMSARIYGVYDSSYLEPLAGLFLRLGYTRVMVVHGEPGLDELSNVGATHVIEIDGDETKAYTLVPTEVGLRTAELAEITSLSESESTALSDKNVPDEAKEDIRRRARESNISDFYRILYGHETGPKLDLALLNSGAGLYLCGLAESVSAGVSQARQIVNSGAARHKVRELAGFAGDPDMLAAVEKRLGL